MSEFRVNNKVKFPFTSVPNEIFTYLKEGKINGNSFSVWVYLLKCADNDTDRTVRKILTIATEVGISKNTVLGAIDQLVQCGLLVVSQRFDDQGRSMASEFTICPPECKNCTLEGSKSAPLLKESSSSYKELLVGGVKMHFPTKDGFWPLDESKMQEWIEVYGKHRVETELPKAKQWLRDNPARQKTKRGMLRFLSAWLARNFENRNYGPPAEVKKKVKKIIGWTEDNKAIYD